MDTTARCAEEQEEEKKKSKVDVIAPQVEQAYGLEPQTAQGQLETSYLLVLALVFAIIILEGLFIATSVSLTFSSIDTLLPASCKACLQPVCSELLGQGNRFNSGCVQGFLPEAADRFAQDVVYPSFSPTVGFFLLLSTAYGIWKVSLHARAAQTLLAMASNAC